MYRAMILSISIICLILMPSTCLNAQPEDALKDSPLQGLLQNYKSQGYSVLGPLQVTKLPKDGRVSFYKHGQVAYKEKEIKAQDGGWTYLDIRSRVYLLKKGDKIVLIELEKENNSNE